MSESAGVALEWSKALAPMIGAAIAVSGVMYSVRQARRSLVNSQTFEAQKPFRQKQLDLCVEVATVVAQIATTEDSETFVRARAAFWELYFGRLVLVEKAALAAEMVRFGRHLEGIEFDSDREFLKSEALRVSTRARELIEASWDVILGPLTDKTGN